MTLIEPQYISYKDPDARVLKTEAGYLRYIFISYKEQYNHLMKSGLFDELIKKQLLIPHQEIISHSTDENIYKLLLPEQINFQSYPFEWSFTQWRKAIFAFLKINQIALKYGMILKDATPYNFYFKAGRATLFDTSSFAFFKENEPWLAYRQFCETFFAPIALMKYNGTNWAKLTMVDLTGLPIQFVSKQLPIKSWFNISCLLHIHLHAKYEFKRNNKTTAQKGFSIKKMELLLDMFISTVKSWKNPYLFNENWVNYYVQDIESPEYLKAKQQIITEWLHSSKPNSVIDLGANTGLFSMIASKIANHVIAVESNASCVDIIDKKISESNIQNITIIVADLSATSPALGMLNKEYVTLLERGKSNMVLALALIHHLCIAKNLSIKHVAELFSTLSTEYLIVEYIPKTDSKVKLLLKSREDIFNDYTEANFKTQISKLFELVEETRIDQSERILYLWKKKSIL